MSKLYYPLDSLREGHWFKLICGASFQDLAAVRSLSLAYTLAGADCIDVAADPAVIAAVKDAFTVAEQGFGNQGLPLLMVSLNDGEDPHFRKAEFDATRCPPECPRPCETVCPAEAITFSNSSGEFSGVIDQRCYGCGRCLPVCPTQLIYTRSYVFSPDAIAPLIIQSGIDAIEIHTKVGHRSDFERLWSAIAPMLDKLKLIAISCPDDPDLIDYLRSLYDLIKPLPVPLIWQTDGRPMSGDIGIGTTRAAVKLAQKVLAAGLPGYVQLAGGTNQHTVNKLKTALLLKGRREELLNPQSSFVAGIAYGSYARAQIAPILTKLEMCRDHANSTSSVSERPRHELTDGAYKHLRFHHLTAPRRCPMTSSKSQLLAQIEDYPDLLKQAVSNASSLVSQIKTSVQMPPLKPSTITQPESELFP